MRNEDVKIGMKVVPHNKSAGWGMSLEDSVEWRRAKNHGQTYLVVGRWEGSVFDGVWVLWHDVGENGGDYFKARDFEPYEENKMEAPVKYLVVSVRKSDGQTFFPENPNHRKGIEDLQTALDIATEKARKNSTDYAYVVYVCRPVAAVELDDKPVKVTVY